MKKELILIKQRGLNDIQSINMTDHVKPHVFKKKKKKDEKIVLKVLAIRAHIQHEPSRK